jgi:hypothetical protein
MRAANYAMAWDHQPNLDPEYDYTFQADDIDWTRQCTLFASSVLYYGEVRDIRDDPIKAGGTKDLDPPYWDIEILKAGSWEILGYEGESSWFNTNNFHKFATTEAGRSVMSYINPPQYNDRLLWGRNASIDQSWENMLRTHRGLIQEGDLVFYGNGSSWGHVAVVVGWGLPTSFSTKKNINSAPSGIEPDSVMLAWIKSLQCRANHYMMVYPPLPLRPLVVERSGVIDYTSWRSLDNTGSKVDVIDIVHIENH